MSDEDDAFGIAVRQQFAAKDAEIARLRASRDHWRRIALNLSTPPEVDGNQSALPFERP